MPFFWEEEDAKEAETGPCVPAFVWGISLVSGAWGQLEHAFRIWYLHNVASWSQHRWGFRLQSTRGACSWLPVKH